MYQQEPIPSSATPKVLSSGSYGGGGGGGGRLRSEDQGKADNREH